MVMNLLQKVNLRTTVSKKFSKCKMELLKIEMELPMKDLLVNPAIAELPEALEMLTQAEKHQLLVEFNDTKVSYPRDKTIIDLFEEKAKRTPQAAAVVFEEQQ